MTLPRSVSHPEVQRGGQFPSYVLVDRALTTQSAHCLAVEHAITVNAGMVALHFWESHCSASPSTTTMKGGSRFDDVEDGDGVGGEGGDDDGGSGDDEAGHGHHDEKEEQEGAGWEGDKPSASGKVGAWHCGRLVTTSRQRGRMHLIQPLL